MTSDEGSSVEEDKTRKHEHTLDMSTSSDSLQYLYGIQEDYLNSVVPLFEASMVGDWETAKIILDRRPDLVRIGLSKNLGTALHVAATAEETEHTLNFVKNLVNMMTSEDLERKNKHSNTAFWIACGGGKTVMAKIMLERNRWLLEIRGNNAYLPLSVGAMNGRYNIMKWLYNNYGGMQGDEWTADDRIFTLLNCVDRDFFDIAVQIVKDRPELAQNVSMLGVLSRKPDALNPAEKNLITRVIESTFRFFCTKTQSDADAEEHTNALELLKIVWGHTTRNRNIYEIEDILRKHPISGYGKMEYSFYVFSQYSSSILYTAAKMGNTRFIVELLRTHPDLIHHTHKHGLTIFHIAVMHRHHGIYNLLYEIGMSRNDVCVQIDSSGNNMLHLVGKSSKKMASKMSGASLLMQRELLWFKEVEKMMPPYTREIRNKDGETPYELFSKENEDLVSKGLKWMKDSMVVAALIVTVGFAAAFTVPGGYNQESGLPLFIHTRSFLVFVIADAISLISSSTSLLVFLSVLTSHHDQREFLYSLPRKLMLGLLTLFISVAAMMVTFSASFFVIYHKGLKWIPIFIATFAIVSVIVFAVLQFPLLVDMFRSTYDSRYLFNSKKRMLYTTKSRSHSSKSSCWWFPFKSIIKRIVFKRG